MPIHKTTIGRADYPDKLRNIHSPPRTLYYLGEPLGNLDQRPAVAIVGSRKVTPYGRQATQDLASGLAKHGVTIISGLAIGVDAIAHQATLEAGGRAVAVLANSLDRIYPAINYQLAKQILRQGGTLLSEYGTPDRAFKSNFVARNRIVSGLANAVLITEAAIDSGSLHTAKFALEQGRDILAVPGNINHELSKGTNNLIKKSTAALVTNLQDVLNILNIASSSSEQREILAANQEEAIILKLLSGGVNDGTDLLSKSNLDTRVFHQTLTMMEITNKIKSAGNDTWMLA